ncbi:cation diffusion facilitator CzcD-associated flavoprotein CzcO [Microbacterium endophyticum]|uniref:Cation diffusion facilitator CzcD-associated flavoprotein CzcO n=1 Tax=Microbacterium endophyticum TaxID=1526412 RepID=A0A7W4V293_9MICO|nr:NAD(P)-binding domain-containing protein [Microbacterium endophyticum]MBB2975508.1 cation diffusion facilitator CzcD-associated flavoprotein CzcO [Microbacterium endophyticum]NIK35473.1 cation diffusion facilitator CzcD-associated flavoprotein CzcO [Microbacterium endophyticum]
MTMLDLTRLPVAIIGAGPVGLAAAAELIERDIDFVVLEKGSKIASSVRLWGHIRLFTPWRHLVDPAAARLLENAGWTTPDQDATPTGLEFVEEYLEPLASLAEIASRLQLDTRVVGVSRERMDRTRSAGRGAAPFLLRTQRTDGAVEEFTARSVIDASGTYATPNPLGSSGLPPIGSDAVATSILPALPDVLGADRARFSGRHTTVVGAGHSAANTLIALTQLAETEPGTRVTWLIRTASAVRVTSSSNDQLSARARLGSRVDGLATEGRIELVDGFEISSVTPDGAAISLRGTRNGVPARHDTDLVVNATGFRPDLDILREIRLDLDDVVEAPRLLAPLIDPNMHSCGTVEPHGFRELTHPDPGFFLVGMKSYGRAPTFLLATGYEQVRSIAAWLAGDMLAATKVQLTLPATGVCSTNLTIEASCCS